ncbi:MAG: spore cortex biosynthesis protein YabQ [Oscillospiraceae bacterium]
MIVPASAENAIYEMLLAAGLSLWLAFLYHVICELFPPKRYICALVFNVIFFASAGFLMFLFILGETYARIPRLHLFAGAVFGAVIYKLVPARYVAKIIRCSKKIAKRIFTFFTAPIKKLAHGLINKSSTLLRRLKCKLALMYNNKKKRTAQRKRKTENGDKKRNGSRKEKVKIETQT